MLGPLLFLCFINDMPNALEFLSILFADDTSYLSCNTDTDKLVSDTNKELAKADDWFRANKLTLNVSKTKFMLFSPQGTFTTLNSIVRVGAEIIERIGSKCETTFFKLVGVLLDDKLSWTHQIANVRKKLASSNYALASLRRLLPLKIKLNVYNSLFRSHLDYGLVIWGGGTHSSVRALEIMQKKALRNVALRAYNAHCEPILVKLNLLNLSDMIKLSLTKLIANYKLGRQPASIEQLFDVFNYNNRTHKFTIDIQRYAYFKKQVPYTLIQNWNMLYTADKNSICIIDKDLNSPLARLNAIKKSLTQQCIAQYKAKVVCNNVRCGDCNPNYGPHQVFGLT